MKKFVVFTLISAMTAGAVFAQVADGISFQAWGRGSIVPLRVEGPPTTNGKTDKDGDGDEMEAQLKAGTGATWGGANRVDFRMQGNASYAGFKFNATAEQDQLMGGDEGAYLWVKPFKNDYLKLTAGYLVDDTLRGKIGLDGFTKFVMIGGPGDEDTIFSRFGTSHSWTNFTNGSESNGGFMLSSKPTDDFFIGLMANAGQYDDAKDVYRNMQIGLGYNIGGIGHVRAQWIGGYLGEDPEDGDPDTELNPAQPARIELAFALTALDGLLLDIGTKLYMPVSGKSGWEKSNGIAVSVGATYRNQAFNLVGRVDAKGLGAHDHKDKKDKSTSGWEADVRLVPAYDLDFATVGASIAAIFKAAGDGYDGKTPDDNVESRIGFGGFIGRSLGNGNVKAGLGFITGPILSGDRQKNESVSGFIFQVPIILEYAFF